MDAFFLRRLRKIRKNKSSGLTLLELLIYITISSGVVIVIVALVAALLRSSNTSNSTAEVRQNASAVSQKITQLIQTASNISTDPTTKYPWISYYDLTAQALAVAQYVGTGGTGCTGNTAWTCVRVDDTANNVGQFTSIVFDSSGNPWVSYYDLTNTSLKVASKGGVTGGAACTDTAWNCTTVDNTATATGQYASIAFDSSGNPWVSYYDSTAGNLALRVASKGGTTGGAACTDTAWNCTTVDNTGTDTGQYTSISFDTSGNAWVSYYDLSNTSLKVANRVGSGGNCTSTTWNCTTIDNDTDDTGSYNSVVFDFAGTPWVSYYDNSASAIMVAKYVGSGGSGCGTSGSTAWICVAIEDTANDIGQYSSLAIDLSGKPEVTYFDNSAKTMKIAIYVGTGGNCTSTAWNCTTVHDNASDDFGQYTAIEFDNLGVPWVSYYSGATTSCDNAPSSECSLNVAYYVGSNGTGCGTGSTAWTCVIVDNPTGTGDFGSFTSIAFEPTSKQSDTLDMAINGVNNRIMVTSLVGSNPLNGVRLIDSPCSDPPQNPDWNCSIIDDPANSVGLYSSLAIDSAGNPWVSYYDSTATSLKVAKYIGSGGNCTSTAWDCTTVDNTSTSTGQFTSIKFDVSGNPWVSYYDSTAGNLALKVASKGGVTGGAACTDTAWNCTTVDNTGTDTGSYTSIAFDASGNPWVSYYDITSTSLKVASKGGVTGGAACTDTAWNCTTVDNQGNNVGDWTSIAFDASGNPWVSYRDVTATGLKVANYVGSGGNCTSTAWNCTTVDDPVNDVGNYTSIAFDPSGNAWISYQDNTVATLRVANLGQAITSSKVYITKCAGEVNYFIKIDNPAPTKDAVRYCFKVNYATGGDPTKAFSQEIRSTVSLR